MQCLAYECGIVSLVCPNCEAKGTGCSIGGAYSNLKTTNKAFDDKDTRIKAALESIARSLKSIAKNYSRMSLEIKPCKFCGVKPLVRMRNDNSGKCTIECENPECPVQPSIGECSTLQEAIETWNINPFENTED